jgi:hypothetical protein
MVNCPDCGRFAWKLRGGANDEYVCTNDVHIDEHNDEPIALVFTVDCND